MANDNTPTAPIDIETYLIEALQSFENDPADTDYQKGYEAALKEVRKVITTPTMEMPRVY
jgi:hypothetical protein